MGDSRATHFRRWVYPSTPHPFYNPPDSASIKRHKCSSARTTIKKPSAHHIKTKTNVNGTTQITSRALRAAEINLAATLALYINYTHLNLCVYLCGSHHCIYPVDTITTKCTIQRRWHSPKAHSSPRGWVISIARRARGVARIATRAQYINWPQTHRPHIFTKVYASRFA